MNWKNRNIDQSFFSLVGLGQLADQHLEDQEEQGLDEIVIRTIRQERRDQLPNTDLDGLAKERVSWPQAWVALVLVGEEGPVLLLREESDDYVHQGLNGVPDASADDEAEQPIKEASSMIFISLLFLLLFPLLLLLEELTC